MQPNTQLVKEFALMLGASPVASIHLVADKACSRKPLRGLPHLYVPRVPVLAVTVLVF